MATLTLRNTVGRPLTYTETDNNFTNLDSDIQRVDANVNSLSYGDIAGAPTNISYFNNDANYLDSAAAISVIGGTVDGTVDSAYINARVDIPPNVSYYNNDAKYLDSNRAFAIIDETYIRANQDYAYGSLIGVPTNVSDFTNDEGFIDSSQAVGAILEHVDEAYVQARQSFDYDEMVNTPTSLSQFVNDTNFTSYDSSDTVGIVDAAYVQAKTSLETLTDTTLTNVQADQFLKWNGVAWINHELNLDGAVVFHGVVDVTTDTAPSNPTNGDLYINNTTGTAGASWTGIVGDLINDGESIVYSGDDSQWYAIGAVSNGGVVEISGGPGITVVDSPDHQYVAVSINQTQLDAWIDSALTDGGGSGVVNTTGDQDIDGLKTFNETIAAGGQSSPDTSKAVHTDGDILIERNDGGIPSLILHSILNTGYQKIQSKNDKLVFNMGTASLPDSDKFAFTAAGRLGIGVISPQYPLDVSGNIHATGDISADGKIDGGIF